MLLNALGLSFVALVVAGISWYFSGRKSVQTPQRAEPRPSTPAAVTSPEVPDIFETAFYQLVLPGSGGHSEQRSDSVIRAFHDQHEKLTEDTSLFPRQPLILPKLLRVVRHESGNAQALVATILEDPGLTADVLKMANSPLYRNTRESVHDIEYAVVLLGIDGLKSLISASIMRPIFQASNRRDRQTTNLFWESALASAYIAQRYANRTMASEAFSAHLLTLLGCTAELITVQTALRLFDEQQAPLDLETFAYLNKKYRFLTTQQLMRAWGMDDNLIGQLANPEQTPLTS